jgi:hypothetical protein
VKPTSGLIIGVLNRLSRSGELLVLVHRLADAPPLGKTTSFSRR